MYLPKHFEQTDPAALQALMREHPLATLIVSGADGTTADLLPLEYLPDAGPQGTLRGHVARANPLWKRAAGAEVLVVFTGPQAYITPSWYPTKAETHKVVPTWNYTVVQACGPLRAIEDAPWLHALVSGLTAHHEAPRAQPWAVADAPDDYVQVMLRAIVGIEIELTQLVGKWKVSQNRNEADRNGVAAGLASPTSPRSPSPTPNALAMARLVAPK
jgi:transcriptional regulator